MKKIIDNNPASVVGITYLTLVIVILLLSSCGSSRQYNIGTGKPMHKQCQGAWTGGQ